MAQVFYPTASQVIDRALEDIAAVDAEGGLTPTTTQRTSALVVLNYIVTSWQAHGMQVWCQKQATHTLTASTSSYTIGSGGDINITARPLTIQQAWIRDTVADPDTDIPIRIISREEYNRISAKATTGVPNCIFYDPEYNREGTNSGATAKGKIYVWPTPDSSVVTQYDLYVVYTRPISDFNATSDTLDFPQEWFNAVRWNLAHQLCPGYTVPLGRMHEIEKLAETSLKLALSSDTENTSTTISPAQN
jgi:hypothetical protein